MSPGSSDTHAITQLVHKYGALAFWDYAAAGPYVDIEMNPRCESHPSAYKDAIFLSPHKFIGGPGTPGVLIVRKELLRNTVPESVNGGTVAFVNQKEHMNLEDVEEHQQSLNQSASASYSSSKGQLLLT